MLTRNPRPTVPHHPERAALFSAAETAALDAINAKAGEAESVEEIVRYIFESTKRFCPCDRIGLALLEDDDRHLVTKAAYATYEPVELNVGYSADISNSSLRRVIEDNQPRVIGDLAHYLAEHPRSESTRLLVNEGVRSSLACPLTVGGRAAGVLFRSSRKPHVYSPRHVRFDLAIAERLGRAVEKARRIEQLDAARRSTEGLLGFVNHELKNALTGLREDIRSLGQEQAGNLTPEQLVYVQRLQARADGLVDLTREYRDMDRLQDGKVAVRVREVDFVADVIQPAIEMSRSQLERHRMPLTLVLGPIAPLVPCDAGLMQTAMNNLITNAIKYGREGGAIRICCEQAADTFRVYVRNDGPGFPVEQCGLLFRPFSRIQTPELLAKPGTGVGLYNTWRILQLHGGQVAADSQLGRWAEFCLEIPLPSDSGARPQDSGSVRYGLSEPSMSETARAPFGPRDTEAWDASFADSAHDVLDEEDEAAATAKRARVLCIDDDPEIREAISRRLADYGVEVVLAASGMPGYWAALESQPDVIIADLNVPDGEGDYLCSRLKSHPLTDRIPMVVLTGRANPAVQRQLLGQGVDAYLAKPINWTELLEALRRRVALSERNVVLATT